MIDEKIKKIDLFIRAKKDISISKRELQLATDYKVNEKNNIEAKKGYKTSVLIFGFLSFVLIFLFMNDLDKLGFLFMIFDFISFLFLLLNQVVYFDAQEKFLKSKELTQSFLNKDSSNLTANEIFDAIEDKHKRNNNKLNEIKDVTTKEIILKIDKSDTMLNSEQILAIKELAAIKKIKLGKDGLLKRNEILSQERRNILEAIKDLSENDSLDDDNINELKKELENYNVNTIEIRNE